MRHASSPAAAPVERRRHGPRWRLLAPSVALLAAVAACDGDEPDEEGTDEAEAQELAADDVVAVTAALRDCSEDLSADGIDLGAFDHRNNAEDVHAVRRALGHDRIDLRGAS